MARVTQSDVARALGVSVHVVWVLVNFEGLPLDAGVLGPVMDERRARGAPLAPSPPPSFWDERRERANARRAARPPLTPRECKHCHKVFTPSVHGAPGLFCSQKCNASYSLSLRYAEGREERLLLRDLRKTKAAAMTLLREAAFHERPCECCGEMFTPSEGNGVKKASEVKYCSKKCANKVPRPRPSKVTQEDVARLAGCSPATVGNIRLGGRGAYALDTIRRVREACLSLGYPLGAHLG